ncbi:MAG: Hsp20/alpha crystallin family protein [Candidatus Thermoplasmatota archaeon]|jgi:HSP20 family protein|nr:Hsp20/alpha crystallin family protein [Candidatus Thermoplasmatota archaeon]MCL6002702.1 Hsp20/alpha crystallin family protein [Candidatus Thermoplasmatota archaeon]
MQIGIEGVVKKAGQRIKTISEVFYPPIDISEDGDEIHIYLDLPGFRKEDVKILSTKSGLKVSGSREKKVEGKVIYEERVDEFSKFIRISSEFESDSIKASLESGVLKITVKRKEVKTVPIN